MNFKEFLDQYQNVPVEEYPNQVSENPIVSVCVQTYQHAPYIRQCLDSILMQKTDFPFEVLVGEDASSDGTREICLEYAKKHPKTIRLFLHHRENNLSYSGIPTGRFNFLFNLYSAFGDYIALCPGDDYWMEPQKLQKQVNFLKENVNYGVVHGNCDIYVQEEDIWKRNANKNLSNALNIKDKKEQFDRLVNADYQIRTATVLFRRSLLKGNFYNKLQFLMGDTPFWLDFSQITKFKYFNEIWSTYRVFKGSVSRPKSKISRSRFILSSVEMRIYYHELYKYTLNKKLKNKYNTALINYIVHNRRFKPKYNLFDPSIIQRLIIKYNHMFLANKIFKINLEILYYAKAVLQKLKKSN